MTATEIVAIATLMLSIFSAWAITSYKYGRMGRIVETNEKRIQELEDSLRKHKEAEVPHATCIGHTACIDNIEKNILGIRGTLDIMNNRLFELVQAKRNNNGGK